MQVLEKINEIKLFGRFMKSMNTNSDYKHDDLIGSLRLNEENIINRRIIKHNLMSKKLSWYIAKNCIETALLTSMILQSISTILQIQSSYFLKE